ncbi:MAG: IS66 family transposase [Methylophilaceae bacterium]
MKINLKRLPKSVEELEKIILLQQQEIDSRDQKIEKQKVEILSYKESYIRLLEEFKLEKSRRFGASSEKNIFQSDLFDEAGVEPVGELKDQIDDTIDVASYQRKMHPVRKPIPKDMPREVIIYDIAEHEKTCGCGAHLVRIGEEVSEQIKYIPAKLSVIQHVRPKYACKPCQENVKIAPMPTLLLPKSLATPELVAYTIIAKYCDHIPLYRQQGIWDRLGIDMPRSSLCGWLLKVADLCEPLVKLLQRSIIVYDYAQADETTVQVLDEVGRNNKTKSYIWCYRGGGVQPSIVYEYQETRGGYHAEEFLLGFKGYLQSDAYSGYNFADKDDDIIRVGCMAHARRKFADIAKIAKTNGLAYEAIKFFKALYKIEKEAHEANLSPDKRLALREEKAKPILTSFKTWLDNYLTKTPIQSKIGEAIRYTLSNWELLNNYLKDGRIEIDNNLIENAIRPFALGRKNWLFMGSPSGARAGATFYSLIETCKANNIEPYKYFCAMLNRIRECGSEDDYLKLLPQFIQV